MRVLVRHLEFLSEDGKEIVKDVTDLATDVTEVIKDGEEIIEEVKEIGVLHILCVRWTRRFML